MNSKNELERFRDDLAKDEALRIKLDETVSRIAASDNTKSDSELFCAAAKELGYEFSVAALERSAAANEELDPDELASAAGGAGGEESCWFDYKCNINWRQSLEDEHGHATYCLIGWHCETITLHTQTNNKRIKCWRYYSCNEVSQHDWSHLFEEKK